MIRIGYIQLPVGRVYSHTYSPRLGQIVHGYCVGRVLVAAWEAWCSTTYGSLGEYCNAKHWLAKQGVYIDWQQTGPVIVTHSLFLSGYRC